MQEDFIEPEDGACTKKDRWLYQTAVRELQQTVASLESEITEEERQALLLKLQLEVLKWMSAQAQFRERAQQLCSTAPVPRSPLSISRLPRSQLVSISALPPSQEWDAEWLSRLAAMTLGDMYELKLDAMRHTALLVVPAKTGGPRSAAHMLLTAIIRKVSDCARHVGYSNNSASVWLARKTYINMETGQEADAAPAEWWEALLRQLKVSKESIQRCVAAELLYRARAAKLGEQRRALQQQLDAALAAQFQQQQQPGSESAGSAHVLEPASGQAMSGRLEAGDSPEALAGALQANLEAATLLLHEHFCYCHSRALTPLEVAQIYMSMYPYNFPFAREVYRCLLP